MSRARARTSGSSSTMRMVSTSGLPRCALPGGASSPLRRDAGEVLAAQHVRGPGLGVPVEALDLLLAEVLLPLAASRGPLLARFLGLVHAELDDVPGHLGLALQLLDPPEGPDQQHGRQDLQHASSRFSRGQVLPPAIFPHGSSRPRGAASPRSGRPYTRPSYARAP